MFTSGRASLSKSLVQRLRLSRNYLYRNRAICLPSLSYSVQGNVSSYQYQNRSDNNSKRRTQWYAKVFAGIGVSWAIYSSLDEANCATQEPVVTMPNFKQENLPFEKVRISKENKSPNVDQNDSSGDNKDGKDDHSTDEKEIHKSHAGFKERKIIEYENRLRAYSTPDKVFRYFATLQDAESHVIYMTPSDFVRSLTPDTMQPPGLGLDEFKKFEKKKHEEYLNPFYGSNSVFRCFGADGLISFSDYIFLLTVLGTTARHIDIAFHMFDLNGDGEVTADEFNKVRSLFLSMSSTGMRHRDHKTTGNVLSDQVNTGIMTYFFNEDGLGKLTVDKFVAFKRNLQHEVMQLEFNSYNPIDGKIKEVEFCEILLTYATFFEKKKRKMIQRVKAAFKNSEDGITFEDYLNFFDFLLNIRDVDMALSFHTVSGNGIGPETFQRVAQTVAEVELRPHLIDVVFKLFDDNDDGQLSNKEFVAVMKDKICRGLNRPKDTGLTRFLGAIYECAKGQISDWIASDGV